MAIVAKMLATEVQTSGGYYWETCDADAEGAIPIDSKESPCTNLYTDNPVWLTMHDGKRAEFVRRVDGTAFETVTLRAVSKPAGSDPDQTNAKWAMASPSGNLSLVIHNPDAWEYIKAGFEYRITIERVRGPRGEA